MSATMTAERVNPAEYLAETASGGATRNALTTIIAKPDAASPPKLSGITALYGITRPLPGHLWWIAPASSSGFPQDSHTPSALGGPYSDRLNPNRKSCCHRGFSTHGTPAPFAALHYLPRKHGLP